MYHNFCIHSSTEGHLGSFLLLANINSAAMNIVAHASLLYIGVSLGYMPRTGIAGFSGSTMSSFLRNRLTDFQSCFISLQPHQQWKSVSLSAQPLLHLLSSDFWILANLTGVMWNHRVVMIWICLMAMDVQHILDVSQLLDFPQLRTFCLALYCIVNRVVGLSGV